MSETRGVVAFVVRRRDEWIYNDEYNQLHAGWVLGAYLDRDKAEARRRELHAADPINYDVTGPPHPDSEWESFSTMPPEEGIARLRAAGLEPPEDGDWQEWYWGCKESLTPEQERAFFTIADRLGKYEVVEMTVEVDEGGP